MRSLQPGLNVPDEFVTLTVDRVLSVKQLATLARARRFKVPDLALSRQLILKGDSGRACPSGLRDLPVKALEIALQPKLQVVGPAVELDRLLVEQLIRPLIGLAQTNGDLSVADIVECRSAPAGAEDPSREGEERPTELVTERHRLRAVPVGIAPPRENDELGQVTGLDGELDRLEPAGSAHEGLQIADRASGAGVVHPKRRGFKPAADGLLRAPRSQRMILPKEVMSTPLGLSPLEVIVTGRRVAVGITAWRRASPVGTESRRAPTTAPLT